LPITPPAALISSMANAMASRTVTSEIAIVPDNEFSEPTLIVGPDASTHDVAFAESDSVALLPQPANSSALTATMLPVASADLLNEERRGSRIDSLSLYQQRTSADGVDWSAEFVTPRRCRIGTLERRCFCQMSVCDEQINL
jgi:hypothetical protein